VEIVALPSVTYNDILHSIIISTIVIVVITIITKINPTNSINLC